VSPRKEGRIKPGDVPRSEDTLERVRIEVVNNAALLESTRGETRGKVRCSLRAQNEAQRQICGAMGAKTRP
jgi:hypothetical protein